MDQTSLDGIEYTLHCKYEKKEKSTTFCTDLSHPLLTPLVLGEIHFTVYSPNLLESDYFFIQRYLVYTSFSLWLMGCSLNWLQTQANEFRMIFPDFKLRGKMRQNCAESLHVNISNSNTGKEKLRHLKHTLYFNFTRRKNYQWCKRGLRVF